MSKRIFKYKLEFTDSQELVLPLNCNPISVNTQKGFICVWVEIDDHGVKVPHRFRIYGTGQKLSEDDSYKYIGTVFDNDFVWHVYYSKSNS